MWTRRRFHIILLAILCLGIGFGARYYYQKKQEPVSTAPTTKVTKNEFLITVNDTGVLKAKKSAILTVPRMERADELKVSKLIPEGSYVKNGDIICWFDVSDLEKQLKETEFQLQRYQSDINNNLENLRLQRENRSRVMQEKKLDWDSAKVTYEIEKKKYDKTKRLVVEEILPQKDLEDEEIKFRSATLQVDQTEKEYLKAQEQQISDEKIKQIDIERAKSQSNWYQREYDQLKSAISKSTLATTDEGIVVYQKNWHQRQLQSIKEGDMLDGGQAVATIPDLREIQIMSQIAETDVSKIKEGLRVRIKMDAIPDLVMTGEITSIGNLAMERERSAGSGQVSTEESAGIKVFELTIDVDSTDTRLRPGMTCKVNVILENITSALSIPIEAVHMETGTKYVLVKKDGKQIKRPVVLGKQNEKQVIVESGLSLGEEIYLPQEES